MTSHNSPATHNVWQETRTIVSTRKATSQRPTQADRPRPATKAEAEQEADRWVAEMMFDHYNG